MRPILTMLVIGALSALAACQSSLTGKEGNLTFYYPTDDELDFNKPIAIGAKLDLTVKTAGLPKAAVELTAVKSSNPQVLAAGPFLGGVFTLEGKGSGSAQITVTAKKSDGTTVSDSIDMMARKPDKIEVYHSCAAGAADAFYLVDKKIFLPYDFKMANGQSVIGYGYHALSVAPAAALVQDQIAKAQWAYLYQTQKLPGDVTVTSQLEPTRSWTLRLVDEGAIDGGKLDALTNKTIEVLAGLPAYVLARPTIGGKPLCQPDTTFSAVSKTPEVCTVAPSAAKAQANKELVEAWSWLTITGKQVGVCQLEVTWPKANKGQGLTVPLKVNVDALTKPTQP